MDKTSIQFHSADVAFVLRQKNMLRQWFSRICSNHKCSIDQLQFVFCSDEYLLEINRQFLQHDYYTDIITFDNGTKKQLNVEAYISIDRVRDNAKDLHVRFVDELHRVMIHGVLHAIGYKDKSKSDIIQMRDAENAALRVLNSLTKG